MRIRIVKRDEIFRDHKHVLTMGISGTGKTNLIESIALDAHDSGSKVIFFDFFKYECCQLGFPETDEMADLARKKHFCEPHSYPHEVLVPFAITTFDRREGDKMFISLPKHDAIDPAKGYSFWKPFKISFSQLKTSDLFVVLRMLTGPGKVAVDFLHQRKKYENIEDLIRDVISLVSNSELRVSFKGESSSARIGRPEIFQAILRLLVSIQQSGFLCDDSNQFRLDLDKIMRSDEVTTFTFANLDNDDLKFMVFVAILRQIKDLRARNHYPKELMLVLPELADVAPASSKISPEAVAGNYSALNIMQLFSRQSRILKITLLCDTQSPKDCNRTVRDNFGWAVLGAMQQNTVRWLNENFVKIPDIPYFKIPHLKAGTYCILPLDSQSYVYPFIGRPCLARHRRRGDDVRSWVSDQPGVTLIKYEDFVRSSLSITLEESQPKNGFKVTLSLSPDKIKQAKEMRSQGQSFGHIARTLKIAKSSVIKYAGDKKGRGRNGVQYSIKESLRPESADRARSRRTLVPRLSAAPEARAGPRRASWARSKRKKR